VKQLDSESLGKAVDAVMDAMAPPVCPTREEALQVLMHCTAAFLEGRSKDYAASYFAKLNEMLSGKFDR
jgi:uncharacterized protein YlaN (UPF0358 family)